MTINLKTPMTDINLEVGVGLNAYLCKDRSQDCIYNSIKHLDSLELSAEFILAGGGSLIGELLEKRKFQNIHLIGKQLSIASMDPMDASYLKTLRDLCEHFEARTAGDFIGWTGVGGRHLHALMPPVLNRSMLEHLKNRINEAQDFLARPLILENVLTPVVFQASEFSEVEFFKLLTKETGALMALNLSTVYMNSIFQGIDPEAYLKQLDWNSIYQLKISLVAEEFKRQIGINSADFDRSLWSLFGLVGQELIQAKHKKFQFILRDEAGYGPAVLDQWVTTSRLMWKEARRGTQGTSRVTASLSS